MAHFLVICSPFDAPKGELNRDIRVFSFYEKVVVGEGMAKKDILRPFAHIRVLPLDIGYWVNRVNLDRGTPNEEKTKARMALATERMYHILSTIYLAEVSSDGTPLELQNPDLDHWMVERPLVEALKNDIDERVACSAAKKCN